MPAQPGVDVGSSLMDASAGGKQASRITLTKTIIRSAAGSPPFRAGSPQRLDNSLETLREKTDYTYSKTGTYSRGYLKNQVSSPNLSRPYLRELNGGYVTTPGELRDGLVDYNAGYVTTSGKLYDGLVDYNTRSRLVKGAAMHGHHAAASGGPTVVVAPGNGPLRGALSRSSGGAHVELCDADDGMLTTAAVSAERHTMTYEVTEITEEEENINNSGGMPARTRRATSTSKSRSPQRNVRARRIAVGSSVDRRGSRGSVREGGGGGGGSSATLDTISEVSKSISMFGLDTEVTDSEVYTDLADAAAGSYQATATPTTASSGEAAIDGQGHALAAVAAAGYGMLVAVGNTLSRWWCMVSESIVPYVVSQSVKSAAWLSRKPRQRSSAATASSAGSAGRRCSVCCLWLLLLLLPLLLTLMACGLHVTGYANMPVCGRLSGIYYLSKDGLPHSGIISEKTRQIIVNLGSLGHTDASVGSAPSPEQQQQSAVDPRFISALDARIDTLRRQLVASTNEKLSGQFQKISEMENDIAALRKDHKSAKDRLTEFDELMTSVEDRRRNDVGQWKNDLTSLKEGAASESSETLHQISSLKTELDLLKASLAEALKSQQQARPMLDSELAVLRTEIGKLKMQMEAFETAVATVARVPCSAGGGGCACQRDLGELEARLTQAVGVLDQRLTSAVAEGSAAGASSAERTNVYISTPNGTGLSEEVVKELVKKELNIYSADKTGVPDFALESIGGKVVSTRCSETYYGRAARVTFLGLPLWYTVNPPSIVIQPSTVPGQCWAFRGSEGYLVVRLALPVKPTSFVIEHIPRSLSPTGFIDSAPKDFSVYGLTSETSHDLTKIGDWRYDSEGPQLQFFPVSDLNVKPYPVVELRVRSNWGNPDYTCLYRFRVHGLPMKK